MSDRAVDYTDDDDEYQICSFCSQEFRTIKALNVHRTKMDHWVDGDLA